MAADPLSRPTTRHKNKPSTKNRAKPGPIETAAARGDFDAPTRDLTHTPASLADGPDPIKGQDPQVELRALREEVTRLRAQTAVSVDVGDGTGQLFVHGDGDSIAVVRKAFDTIAKLNEQTADAWLVPLGAPDTNLVYGTEQAIGLLKTYVQDQVSRADVETTKRRRYAVYIMDIYNAVTLGWWKRWTDGIDLQKITRNAYTNSGGGQ